MPDEVEFATKPQLAGQMLIAALDAAVPARWVTADEVYGDTRALRAELPERRVGCVLAVGCDTGISVPRRRCRADVVVAGLPHRAGQTARACPMDHGTGSRSQILVEATSTVPW